jgi:hypothetical protein
MDMVFPRLRYTYMHMCPFYTFYLGLANLTVSYASSRYDEGTAFLPVVAYKRQLPKSDRWPFLALDAEGHDLPTDWYI